MRRESGPVECSVQCTTRTLLCILKRFKDELTIANALSQLCSSDQRLQRRLNGSSCLLFVRLGHPNPHVLFRSLRKLAERNVSASSNSMNSKNMPRPRLKRTRQSLRIRDRIDRVTMQDRVPEVLLQPS